MFTDVLKGLYTTLRSMLEKPVTVQYPEERLPQKQAA